MSAPCCEMCLYYAPGTTKAFPDCDGMCRRHAPQGAVVGCANQGFQVFPPMMAHQWCGEYFAAAEHLHQVNVLPTPDAEPTARKVA